MSVVARQGFKYSVIGYIATLIGMFSIFIFTNNLFFYGTLRYLMSAAEMLVPFVVLGISYSNVKFFGRAQEDGKNQNMLSLSLALIFFNFLLFLVIFFAHPFFLSEFTKMKIWENKKFILPLVLILSLCAVFNRYISNYKRIVVSNIFDNLLPKLANLGFFLPVLLFSVFRTDCAGIFLRDVCFNAYWIYLLHKQT